MINLSATGISWIRLYGKSSLILFSSLPYSTSICFWAASSEPTSTRYRSIASSPVAVLNHSVRVVSPAFIPITSRSVGLSSETSIIDGSVIETRVIGIRALRILDRVGSILKTSSGSRTSAIRVASFSMTSMEGMIDRSVRLGAGSSSAICPQVESEPIAWKARVILVTRENRARGRQ